MSAPEVTCFGILDTQVCVPVDFTDEQVIEFAQVENPCGTREGWQIRRKDDPLLSGCAERVTCDERANFVHIVLDA